MFHLKDKKENSILKISNNGRKMSQISILSFLLTVLFLSIATSNYMYIESSHEISTDNEFIMENIWETNTSSLVLRLHQDAADKTVKNVLIGDFEEENETITEDTLELALTYMNNSDFAFMLSQVTNISVNQLFNVDFGIASYDIPISFNTLIQYQSYLIQAKSTEREVINFGQILGYSLSSSDRDYYGISMIPDFLNDLINLKINSFVDWQYQPDYEIEVTDEADKLTFTINYFDIPILFQEQDIQNNLIEEIIINQDIPPICAIFDNIEFEWTIFSVNGSYDGYEIVMKVSMEDIKALIFKGDDVFEEYEWEVAFQDNLTVEFDLPVYIQEIIREDTFMVDLGKLTYYLSDIDIRNRLNLLDAEFSIIELTNSYSSGNTTLIETDDSLLWLNDDVSFMRSPIEGQDIWFDGYSTFSPVNVSITEIEDENFSKDLFESSWIDYNMDALTDSVIKANYPKIWSWALGNGTPIHDMTNIKFGYGLNVIKYKFENWKGDNIIWFRHQQIILRNDFLFNGNDNLYSNWSITYSFIGLMIISATMKKYRKKRT